MARIAAGLALSVLAILLAPLPAQAQAAPAAQAALAAPAALTTAPELSAKIPEQAVTILDCNDTFWRWVSNSRPACFAVEADGGQQGQPGAAELTTLAGKKIDAKVARQVEPELPAGWANADFDDSAWPRTAARRLPNLAFLTDSSSMGHTGTFLRIGQLALRAKFNVADPVGQPGLPAQPGEQLYLSLRFRGGVVVYLNGREVARAGLPDLPAPLAAGTPGSPYPAEAYLDAAGKPLPERWRIKPGETELIRRHELRDRELGPIGLPVKLLRKGVNVLAIELHRSDYHPIAAKFTDGNFMAAWTPCGLTALRLAARGLQTRNIAFGGLVGTGAVANNRRPGGVQVWNQDRNDRTTAFDYGDPNEPLRPILLAGARSGVFSGKVVVSSDKPLEGLEAIASELKVDPPAGGKSAIIPAGQPAVQVRYAEAMQIPDWTTRWVEPMSPAAPQKVTPAAKSSPPGAGAAVAVWVTVRVPRDAAAGDYTGTLTLSAGSAGTTGAAGATGTAGAAKLATIPVKLHVADFSLPDPRQFRTFVGVYQSPTAIALTYKVPEWSDRHWELMDRSMDLLGQLGTQMVQIPVVDQTKLGNEDGMVYWVKKGDQAGGAAPATTQGPFDYDFSVVERYLKLVKKHLGAPKFVVLHIYHAGGWTQAGAKQENTVTVVDPKTGQREHLQVPEFGTEESRKFWAPVLTGLKERLAKEGMEKSLCLGSLCENLPTPAENKMFTEILGDEQWMQLTHASHGSLDQGYKPMPGGGQVTFHIYTYLSGLPDPDKPPPPVHKGRWPRIAYYRHAQGATLPLIGSRLFAPHALLLQLPGVSHMCLDFWPVPQGRRERGGLLYGRWPRAGNYPGDPEPAYLTWPGPNGAEPMTAYESFREGLQDAEAMIVISEALDKNADKLTPELAQRCRQVLKDELVFARDRDFFKYQFVFYHMNHYGWQELSGRLLTLAGEVSQPRSAGR